MDSIAPAWHRGGVSELNATSAALLGLLQEGPKTGGQLVAAATERFGGFFSVTRSQVYRELPVMTDAGLLRLGKRGPRSSQQYVITAAGKRAFKSWLNTEPGPDNVRSPLILRLVHAGLLTPKQRANLVNSAREQYAEKLSESKSAAKAADDPYEKAAADFTVAYNRAIIKLIDAIPE
ncbi:PadR family transcriptional regulator [Halopolyspora algeriensis]|uniref:PadR family transcriptional regulator n=1 Tax=Halopolyspora algeriensis TaxID=1500506 RepID=A0A368VMZ5_9ACTN|nr:PadR family transcriptional regulator [Halopolyspora algeriensis]TQM56676.1 PadR family transcriptional regulator [Halopolyspora algeriensis]